MAASHRSRVFRRSRLLDRVYMVKHPLDQQLYVLGEPESFDFGPENHGARIVYDDTGTLDVVQPSVPLGGGGTDFVSGFAIDPTGSRLMQLGYSGTGLAYTDLMPDGSIPMPDNVELTFLTGTQAMTHALATPTDIVFVSRITGGEGVVSTTELVVDGLDLLDEEPTTGSRCTFEQLYDYEVLVAGCSFGAALATFTVSENLADLTPVATDDTLPEPTFQSMVPIACPG